MFGRSRRGTNAADEQYDADAIGPFDIEQAAPQRLETLLDLGSILIPVPADAELRVQVSEDSEPQAVHLGFGDVTLSIAAYAGPTTTALWPTLVPEMLDALGEGNAEVVEGPFGQEIHTNGQRFIGADGERWMIRGVLVGPDDQLDGYLALAREVIGHTVVRRGDDPMQLRRLLPLTIPDDFVEAIARARSAGDVTR